MNSNKRKETDTVTWEDFQLAPRGYSPQEETPEERRERLVREKVYRLNKNITKDYRKLTRALGKRQGTGTWIPDAILRITSNFTYAGVLMRVVWHCGSTGRFDGWMYKQDEELGNELYLTVDQVRTARKRLLEMGYIRAEPHMAEGKKVMHYAIDAGNILTAMKLSKVEVSDALEQALVNLEVRVNRTAINILTQKRVMRQRKQDGK